MAHILLRDRRKGNAHGEEGHVKRNGQRLEFYAGPSQRIQGAPES